MNKSLVEKFIFISLLASLSACTQAKKEDSAQIAQVKNEENLGTRDEEKDADFVVRAVEGNYAEIKLAQLALNKSTDLGIKEIATMLEKDHIKMLNDLKDLSYKKGMAIPVEESKDTKDDVRDLSREEQDQFNNNWLKKLAGQHQTSIKDYESVLKKTQDVELKAWINNTLPGIKMHLEKINAYQDKGSSI